MATPITSKRYRLRAGSPVPRYSGSGCPSGSPVAYVVQSFGVEVSEVDSWDSIVGLYPSNVMMGLNNYEDTDSYRAKTYVRISYTGTNSRNTDGQVVFRGTEEKVPKWVDEQSAGLSWI